MGGGAEKCARKKKKKFKLMSKLPHLLRRDRLGPGGGRGVTERTPRWLEQAGHNTATTRPQHGHNTARYTQHAHYDAILNT